MCEPRRPGLVGHPCTFEGPGLRKHHQNSTRTGVGEGKRRAKFSAVRRGSGGDGEGPNQQHNNTQQHTNNTQQHPTTTPTTTQHKNGLAKIRLDKLAKPQTTNLQFGPKMDWPKLDWPKSATTAVKRRGWSGGGWERSGGERMKKKKKKKK